MELDLAAQVGTQKDHGNLIGLLSTFTRVDGSQQVLTDVWFAKDVVPQQTDLVTPVTLGDLLAAPAAELLAGPATPTPTLAAPAPQASSPSLPAPLRTPLDDEPAALPWL